MVQAKTTPVFCVSIPDQREGSTVANCGTNFDGSFAATTAGESSGAADSSDPSELRLALVPAQPARTNAEISIDARNVELEVTDDEGRGDVLTMRKWY